MSRRAVLITVVISAIALGLLGWAFTPGALEVAVGEVSQGAFVETVADDGVTRVRERYIITAPVSGTLLRPTVKPGDAVERNQVVAEMLPATPDLLDPRTQAELLARRDAAEARSARTRSLVRQAETARQQAELDVRRLEELAAQGYISKTQREQAALSLDAKRRELEAARFEADASFHDLEQSKAAVSRLAEARSLRGDPASAWPVRSPIAGRVLNVTLESGGPVNVGSAVLEVGDIGQLEAVIDVLSTEATRIHPGAPVTLVAGNSTTLSGRVRVVEPAARTKISALGVEEQRVNVVVDLDPHSGTNPAVGDGYRVDAQIEVARIPDALQVPTAALYRRGDAWAVYLVRNGRAHATEIELGAIGPETSVVLSGLSKGDAVVVYPGDDLEDGRRIQSP